MSQIQFAIRSVLTMLLLVCPFLTSAQSLELASGEGGFRETVLEAARISGSVLVGAQDHGASQEIHVGAHVPEAWAGATVCSRVATIDGLYEATNAYLVPDGWSGGVAAIPHPTAFPDRLQDRPLDAIGVRVTLGPCNVPPRQVAVGIWGDPMTGVGLLVNGLGAEGVFAYLGDNPTPVRCMPLELGGRSAFDTRCDLSGVGGRGRTELELIRVVNGIVMPSTELILWLPEE